MAFSSPAYAQGIITLPAPDALTLLSLGVAGLLIGRQAAARRHRDNDEHGGD